MGFSNRFGNVFRSVGSNKYPADSVAAAFSGVIDSFLAAGGTGLLFAGSTSHRLYSAYTGPLARVRRASDNAVADILYSVATNRLDTAALADHCGASDGFLVTIYDQSGAAKDVTQATAANQPKIYDGATGVVLKGSLPTPTFVRASSQRLARGDALGMTGAPALTHAYFGHANSTAARSYMMAIGGAGANDFYCGYESTNDPQNGSSAATLRRFTETTALTTSTFMMHRIAAGANMSASTCRQDGVDLVQSSVVAGGPFALTNTAFVIGGSGAGGSTWDGGGSSWFEFNADLSGAPLAAIEAYGAAVKLLSV